MKFDELLNLLESQEELNITKTFYDKAKTKPKEIIYKNADGKVHRLDGPAYQSWYSNGKLSYESWYKDGKYHRLDGPADQSWYDDGQLEYEKYYINGIEYTKEEFDEYVKGLESKEDLNMLTDLGQTFD